MAGRPLRPVQFTWHQAAFLTIPDCIAKLGALQSESGGAEYVDTGCVPCLYSLHCEFLCSKRAAESDLPTVKCRPRTSRLLMALTQKRKNAQG